MSRMTETDQRLVSAALDAREHPEPVPGYLLGGPCRWCGHDRHDDGPCSASISARTSKRMEPATYDTTPCPCLYRRHTKENHHDHR